MLLAAVRPSESRPSTMSAIFSASSCSLFARISWGYHAGRSIPGSFDAVPEDTICNIDYFRCTPVVDGEFQCLVEMGIVSKPVRCRALEGHNALPPIADDNGLHCRGGDTFHQLYLCGVKVLCFIHSQYFEPKARLLVVLRSE